jgi:hypothetical protein
MSPPAITLAVVATGAVHVTENPLASATTAI